MPKQLHRIESRNAAIDAPHASESECERSRRGFSFVELMCVIAIMTLVSLMMARGVRVAYDAYLVAVDAANAHVLMGTTAGRLREELAAADPSQEIQCGIENDKLPSDLKDEYERGLVSFVSLRSGLRVYILQKDDQSLWIAEYTNFPVIEGSKMSGGPSALVPSKTQEGIAGALTAIVSGVSYKEQGGYFNVQGLKVIRPSKGQESIAGAEVQDAEGNALDFKVEVIAHA